MKKITAIAFRCGSSHITCGCKRLVGKIEGAREMLRGTLYNLERIVNQISVEV